jgi:regulator of sigma E protease
MSFLITIVAFIAVLAVLIFAHELGHFATAKWTGVKVYEFAMGYPPRIFGFKRGETIYSINAVPLGGFTKMAGEEDPKEPRGLANKSYPVRLLVLSAGSIMNALLPFLLFAIAFMVPHNVSVGNVYVTQVSDGSPAAIAGLQIGDQILDINGRSINNTGDLSRFVQENLGKEIDLTVKHIYVDTLNKETSTSEETVRLTPRWRPPDGQGAIGIALTYAEDHIDRVSEPVWRAVPLSVNQVAETYTLFKSSIIGLFLGSSSLQVTGPVGIAQLSGEVAKAGISPLLEFTAFLSINLAIVNLLPLPALDGGRIVFVLLELIRRGRRISTRTEQVVHLIGFVLLMMFTLVITYGDVVRLITGGNVLP